MATVDPLSLGQLGSSSNNQPVSTTKATAQLSDPRKLLARRFMRMLRLHDRARLESLAAHQSDPPSPKH
jgi:hypothetical protein